MQNQIVIKSVSSGRGTAILLPALLALLSLFLAGGCSLTHPHEDPTRFYVLRSADGKSSNAESPAGTHRWRVGIRAIEVPSYLKAVTMPVRLGPNEITYSEFSRWAEPLDQGIARLCKEALVHAPNVESVALNSRGGNEIDFDVTLRILACEGVRENGGTSAISFKVAWEMHMIGNPTAVKRGLFEAKPAHWNGSDYGQLAEHLSGAVGQLGTALAAALPAETAK